MHLKILTISILILSASALGGCASSAVNATSSTAAEGAAARHAEALSIKVTGGAGKSTDSASQVSNPDFTAALRKSLDQSHLFAKIVPAGQSDADYQLEVTIAALQPPSIGASMTATVEANWVLTRISNGFVIWQKVVSADHTTEAKEAFTGIERVQLAIEGATQDNVKAGTTQLAAVSLP